MSSGEAAKTPHGSSEELASVISELQKKHLMDLQNLTLVSQPLKTSHFFILATLQYLKTSVIYIVKRSGLLLIPTIVGLSIGLFAKFGGLHEKHIQEFTSYARFILWWVTLGILSSIGLGSGLHTFVLYLGPHIAFFTIKAMKCGRSDLKTAPYDTIQFKTVPSWLEKDCSDFGDPLYPTLPGSHVRVPLSSVLLQVQLEAFLWGLGTALGELPPYFISRAAWLSGNKVDAMEELNSASSDEDGFFSSHLKKIKRRLLSQFQHLNFVTILLLASVPNPLFDLAGIMCGQFGIPFWKFFLATMMGKAVIKTHIQAIFIISLCNNQLLEWVENKLLLVLGLIPGLSSLLPRLITKLHAVQDKYMSAPVSSPSLSDGVAKRWNLSFTLVWNSVIWLMLINFFMKIVDATAQQYLKKKQDLEMNRLSLEPKLRSE